MKTFIFLFILVISTLSVSPSDFILNEVNEPKTLNVSGDKLVISENQSILIYSLSEKRLMKQFGKNGEGPGEFKLGHGAGSLKIDIDRDKLVVNSGGKLSWFTMEGEFLKETKIPPMSYIIPVRNNYIGNCLSPVDGNFPSLSVCLFDGNMKKTNIIFNSKIPVGMGAKIMVPSYKFIYKVYKNNIYLSAGKEDIKIMILNNSGKTTGNIQLKNPGLKVDEKFKKRVFDFYKNDPVYKNYWAYMKRNMYFPEYFPGLKDLKIDNGYLYIQTYKIKNEKFEWIITSLNGKIVKKIFLPQNIESAIAYSPVTIHNGKYYYLKEDVDDEIWELHIMDLGLKKQ
ncbi:MAG: hypothetical protein KAR14_09785 [Candidatus Aminicenantes bacterium]|nr:hypothetical protein [Candidatus Aminicenantes bacterium]